MLLISLSILNGFWKVILHWKKKFWLRLFVKLSHRGIFPTPSTYININKWYLVVKDSCFLYFLYRNTDIDLSINPNLLVWFFRLIVSNFRVFPFFLFLPYPHAHPLVLLISYPFDDNTTVDVYFVLFRWFKKVFIPLSDTFPHFRCVNPFFFFFPSL